MTSVVTGPFTALRHRFAVRTDDVEIAALVDEVFDGLRSRGAPTVVYGWQVAHGRHTLAIDDEVDVTIEDQAYVLQRLVWHVNQRAINHSCDLVLLHASAASLEGTAVVMSGPMEVGKTTLVAGLIRHGFDYVTDEAVAIEPGTLMITPYAKPLAVDSGSWPVLPELRPAGSDRYGHYVRNQWLVPPQRAGAAVAVPLPPPRVFVLPRYTRGSNTTTRRLQRSEMLRLLLEQTFRLDDGPRWRLETLARAVAGAECYAMTIGDLDEGCRQILSVTTSARKAQR